MLKFCMFSFVQIDQKYPFILGSLFLPTSAPHRLRPLLHNKTVQESIYSYLVSSVINVLGAIQGDVVSTTSKEKYTSFNAFVKIA